MKTVKFVLFAALLSFFMTGYATKAPDHHLRSAKITLEQAKSQRSLVFAMYEQIDQSQLLAPEKPGPYVAAVRCGYTTYFIYATYKEWKTFFTIVRMSNRGEPPEL